MPRFEVLKERISKDIIRIAPWQDFTRELLPPAWENLTELAEKELRGNMGDFDEFGPQVTSRGEDYIEYTAEFPDNFFGRNNSGKVTYSAEITVEDLDFITDRPYIEFGIRADGHSRRASNLLAQRLPEEVEKIEYCGHGILRCVPETQELLEFIDVHGSKTLYLSERELIQLVERPEQFFAREIPYGGDIMDYIQQQGGEAHTSDVADYLNQTNSGALDKLDDLTQAGMLKKDGRGGHNSYCISDEVDLAKLS